MGRAISRLLRLARRLSVAALFIGVGSGLWLSQEQRYREAQSWQGVPTWSHLSLTSFHRVMRNDGYLLGWSDVRAGALWVSYQLAAVDDASIGSRPGFSSDWRTLWPIGTGSYSGSGYDRGHLAPNYAIAAVHGRQAQLATFNMSNILPQTPALNRQLWQRLEEVVMDHFAPRFQQLQVITGPVYAEGLTNAMQRVGFVEVPKAFYKIIVAPHPETPLALAFIMPQDVQGNEPLDNYLVTIDEIEARTGLNFFPDLSPALEQHLESQQRTHGWALEEVARKPGRFQ